ncbi:MAG: hypothetical protein AAFR14_03790 [Bacteroidota bacterium]
MNGQIQKWISNQWLITLTATVLGVFGALYLNEWVANYKLDKQVEVALDNVQLEIDGNMNSLQKAVETHRQYLAIMQLMNTYMEDEELVTTPEVISEFQSSYPDLMTITDSVKVGSGTYRYKGQINADLSLPQINLRSIALPSIINSGLANALDFSCLMLLEGISTTTIEIKERNQFMLNSMFGIGEQLEDEAAMKYLSFLIDLEFSFIEVLEQSKEELKECS